MNDNDDSGGLCSGHRIVDNAIGNVFGPISSLVREATGYVYAREVYAGVDTPDASVYYSALALITKGPSDSLLQPFLFWAGNAGMTWNDARNILESFIAQGPQVPWYLIDNAFSGQTTIILIGSLSAALPVAGTVYVLIQGNNTQYIQVLKVSSVQQTFTVANGTGTVDITRNVITIIMADPLQYNFTGGVVNQFDTPGPTLMYYTTNAPAVSFKSIFPISGSVAEHALSVSVGSIYGTISPSNTAETSLTPSNPLDMPYVLSNSGNGNISIGITEAIQSGTKLYFQTPIMPGTLTCSGGASLADDGTGNLYSGSVAVGTVDYANSLVTMLGSAPTYAGTKTFSYEPGAAPQLNVQTISLPINSSTTGTVFQILINPPPARRTLRVSYLNQNVWYELYEQGNGHIEGADPAYGSGSYSWTTNACSVTLGAEPDNGSAIIFEWGIGTIVQNRTGGTAPKVYWVVQSPGGQVGWVPGTISITWPNPTGGNFTATDDGAGNLHGDATGPVYYAQGYCWFYPNVLPAGGPVVTLTAAFGPKLQDVFHSPARNPDNTITINLSNVNVLPGSIEMIWPVGVSLDPWTIQTTLGNYDETVDVRDNAVGGLQSGHAGSINYTTGVITFTPDVAVAAPVSSYQMFSIAAVISHQPTPQTTVYEAFRWHYLDQTAIFPTDGTVTVSYRSGTSSSFTQTITLINPTVALAGFRDEQVVPGSVRFTIGDWVFTDKSGSLFANVDPLTDTGSLVGTIDYSTDTIVLTAWPNATNSIAVQSLATTLGSVLISQAIFRAPSSPLQPGGSQITATKQDGSTISISVPIGGVINQTDVQGSGDDLHGFFSLQFGNWVTAAGNESQWWYNANYVTTGGLIWKPVMVYASSIRFSGVAYTYLPSTQSRIGINARRLPPNGQVPVVQLGDIVAIHYSSTHEISGTITAGQLVSLGYTNLARISISDTNGLDVPALETTWSPDFTGGNVVFSTSLNLSGYVQPFTVAFMMMERRIVSSVNINGTIGLNLPLLNAYPSGSYLSGCIELGNLQALVPTTTMFAQSSWSVSSPVWSDVLIGSKPSLTFDEIDYKIAVTNNGAIQERWACYFLTSTTYQCYGENVGLLNTTPVDVSSTFAPINPVTQTSDNPSGVPYFTIPAGALKGGSTGNVFRFNTSAAKVPVWTILTVIPGASSITVDGFEMMVIGDSA